MFQGYGTNLTSHVRSSKSIINSWLISSQQTPDKESYKIALTFNDCSRIKILSFMWGSNWKIVL